MLQNVAFRCVWWRKTHRRAVGFVNGALRTHSVVKEQHPTSKVPRHHTEQFPDQSSAKFLHGVVQRVAAGGVNVTGGNRDFDRRRTDETTSPALARAVVNRCGAFTNREFGAQAENAEKSVIRDISSGPVATYATFDDRREAERIARDSARGVQQQRNALHQ